MLDAGLPGRVDVLGRLQDVVARNASLLAGHDESALSVLKTEQGNVSVQDCIIAAQSARTQAQGALSTAKCEHAELIRVKDRATTLGEQLRDVAIQLLQSVGNTDTCPLCHTAFDAGELAQRMQIGVDGHLEVQIRESCAQIRERENAVHAAQSTEVAAVWLGRFCELANCVAGTPVVAVCSQVEAARVSLVGAQRHVAVLMGSRRNNLDKLQSGTNGVVPFAMEGIGCQA
jgi:hypothetical protein